jgi:hypothetical protein
MTAAGSVKGFLLEGILAPATPAGSPSQGALELAQHGPPLGPGTGETNVHQYLSPHLTITVITILITSPSPLTISEKCNCEQAVFTPPEFNTD